MLIVAITYLAHFRIIFGMIYGVCRDRSLLIIYMIPLYAIDHIPGVHVVLHILRLPVKYQGLYHLLKDRFGWGEHYGYISALVRSSCINH